MIAQLRGTLSDKSPNQVVVDVGGVGYLVHIPLSTYAALGDLHDEVILLVHTHMRDDGISLYGFLSSRERHCFELLIAASGVGPVLAMKILSGKSVDELVPAIRRGDIAALTQIPGVGRKTAERIVLELRDKLGATASVAEAVKPISPNDFEGEVVVTLQNMGYDSSVAEKAVEEAQRSTRSETFEELIRAALHLLRIQTRKSLSARR
jgi:Holliday junction DNA helicase RuvA